MEGNKLQKAPSRSAPLKSSLKPNQPPQPIKRVKIDDSAWEEANDAEYRKRGKNITTSNEAWEWTSYADDLLQYPVTITNSRRKLRKPHEQEQDQPPNAEVIVTNAFQLKISLKKQIDYILTYRPCYKKEDTPALPLNRISRLLDDIITTLSKFAPEYEDMFPGETFIDERLRNSSTLELVRRRVMEVNNDEKTGACVGTDEEAVSASTSDYPNTFRMEVYLVVRILTQVQYITDLMDKITVVELILPETQKLIITNIDLTTAYIKMNVETRRKEIRRQECKPKKVVPMICHPCDDESDESECLIIEPHPVAYAHGHSSTTRIEIPPAFGEEAIQSIKKQFKNPTPCNFFCLIVLLIILVIIITTLIIIVFASDLLLYSKQLKQNFLSHLL